MDRIANSCIELKDVTLTDDVDKMSDCQPRGRCSNTTVGRFVNRNTWDSKQTGDVLYNVMVNSWR